MPADAAPQPSPTEARIVSLDALRGFAVLGIFMMNVQTFAMVQGAYYNPLAQMDFDGANRLVWIAGHVFFEAKFITLFSALFGAGLAMTLGRAARGLAPGAFARGAYGLGDPDLMARHWRRMLWLLLIGMIHAYALWYGDILVSYALLGLVAPLLLDRRPGALIGIGLLLCAATAALFWSLYSSWESLGGFALSQWTPSARAIVEAGELARAPWPERVWRGAAQTADVQVSSLLYYGPRVLGCMLIGAALYRLGFLTAAWSARRYRLAALALVPGLVLCGLSAFVLISGGFLPGPMKTAVLLTHAGSLLMALGYAALVMLAARTDALRAVVRPFAAVGRMALTNYIAQSLIAALVFYGAPGLGLFGTVERAGQFALVLGVWALLLVWSPLWLSVFRFGPLEWVWRSLTYKAAQPMLLRRAGIS